LAKGGKVSEARLPTGRAESEGVRVVVDAPVRTVTLARPAKRNALNAAMLNGLLEAFVSEPSDGERVAVIRAEGTVFCAGLDLTDRIGGASISIESALHAIETYPLPVVAAVGGDAIAGGAELALHCDLIVASSEARFGMSLAQIGLAPPWALAVRLLDAAGPAVAREILMLGDPVAAARLGELGIVARVASPHAFEPTVDSVVSRLAQNAPLSLRAIKATLSRAMEFRSAMVHDEVNELIGQAARSGDAREGMQARLHKRSPRFTGR
jgi:enoyl-CoA hydratase/carnithine racemase